MHNKPPRSRTQPSLRILVPPPASMSPTLGPPATTTMNTPCKRPRRWSGAEACRMVVRKTALTESAMPASPQHRAAGSSHHVTPPAPEFPASTTTRPKPAIEAPQPITDQTTAVPCRRTAPSGPEKRPARNAPTAVEASRMPTVVSPPPIMTAPIAGRSARGWARIIATRSITKVIRKLGRVPRNRKPSTTERRPAGRACSPGGMAGRRRRAHRAKAKVATSTVYVQAKPTEATRSPASRGPAVRVRPKLIMLSAFAAGRSSLRINTGIMALRAGWLMAWAPLCTATRTYSSQIFPSCSQACSARQAVVSHSTDEASSATLRRSWASAIEPPSRPPITNGTRAKMLSSPTYRLSWVSR
ncbi:hypothetical protein BJQ89_01260 [Arthrobacter sp. ES1]|nr:hypothetical protein [Arthrobacter sp. ES1]